MLQRSVCTVKLLLYNLCSSWESAEPWFLKSWDSMKYTWWIFTAFLTYIVKKKKDSTKTIYLIFSIITYVDFCKSVFSLNVMPASCFKHIGTGSAKDWESCRTIQKHLFGVHWWQLIASWLGMKRESWWGEVNHLVKNMFFIEDVTGLATHCKIIVTCLICKLSLSVFIYILCSVPAF